MNIRSLQGTETLQQYDTTVAQIRRCPSHKGAPLLDELLTNEDRVAGFTLWEDDYYVYILQYGHQIVRFSKSMTKENLWAFLDLIIQIQQLKRKAL